MLERVIAAVGVVFFLYWFLEVFIERDVILIQWIIEVILEGELFLFLLIIEVFFEGELFLEIFKIVDLGEPFITRRIVVIIGFAW